MDLERGTATRLSLTKLSKKFSLKTRDYAKVDDMYDTRIPLHNEDVFQHGLKFKAKYVGSLEIAKPTCKLDIIAAMRRIRYEFKVKGVRKKRCHLDISIQGVKVTKRKRRRRRKQYTDEQLFVMRHPIYRIFYVSHDSQDLKIFSYITREVPDNTFRCNVFKAYRKNAALHIVRSLGQAFDVCHRLNPKPKKKEKKEGEEGGEGEGQDKTTVEPKEDKKEAESSKELGDVPTDLDAAIQRLSLENGTMNKTDPSTDIHADLVGLQFDPFATPAQNLGGAFPLHPGVPNGEAVDPFQSPFFTSASLPAPLTVNNTSTILPDFPDGDISKITIPPPYPHLAYRPRPKPPTSQQNVITENPFTEGLGGSESPTLSIGEPLSTILEGDGVMPKEGNPFREIDERAPSMWELEKQQMMAQFALLTEQLKAETAQRIESQARVEHLLMQNKELLAHLQKLMAQLQQLHSLQLASATSAKPTSPPPASLPAQPTPPPSSSPSVPPEIVSSPAEQPPPISQLLSPSISPSMNMAEDPLISPGSPVDEPAVPSVSPRPVSETPTTHSSDIPDTVVEEEDLAATETREAKGNVSSEHSSPSAQFPVTFDQEPTATFPVTFTD